VRAIRMAALACAAGAILWAQQFKFNLDHLAAKAADSVDVSLNSGMLQFAGKFLNGRNSDEAKAKKLIGGLEGIYVKSFEFKNDGAWSQADVDQVRNQLKAPEWSRIVGVKSNGDSEIVEVYVRNQNGKVTGVAILATEAKQFTVANIVGAVDLDSLADLGGQFGLPKLDAIKPPVKKK
jgi:hypothetical protein